MIKNKSSLFIMVVTIQTILVLVLVLMRQQFLTVQKLDQIVMELYLRQDKPTINIEKKLTATNAQSKASWLMDETKLRYIIREELSNTEMSQFKEAVQVDENVPKQLFDIDESEMDNIYAALETLVASGSTNFMRLEQFYNQLGKLNSKQQQEIMSRLSHAINSQTLIVNNQ